MSEIILKAPYNIAQLELRMTNDVTTQCTDGTRSSTINHLYLAVTKFWRYWLLRQKTAKI